MNDNDNDNDNDKQPLQTSYENEDEDEEFKELKEKIKYDTEILKTYMYEMDEYDDYINARDNAEMERREDVDSIEYKKYLLRKMGFYLNELVFTNFVINAKLNVDDIDVQSLAIYNIGASWRKSVFSSLRFMNAGATCSIFGDGRMSSMGAQTEASAFLAVRKHVRVLNQNMGLRCQLSGSMIRNVVASVKVFPIDLDKLHGVFNKYIPPHVTFPAAYFYYNQIDPLVNVVVTMFATGSVNLIGGRTKDELRTALRFVIFNFLIHVMMKCNSNTVPLTQEQQDEIQCYENDVFMNMMHQLSIPMDEEIQQKRGVPTSQPPKTKNNKKPKLDQEIDLQQEVDKILASIKKNKK